MTDQSVRTVRLTPEDHASYLDNIFMITMLVMDPIKDTTELKESLVALLRKEGFNKLAAQLRYDKDHNLEHVFTPRTYDNPITITERTFSTPLSSDPLGALIPLNPPSKTTSFLPEVSTYNSLFQHPSCVDTLSALLALQDHPPLSVHFSQFTDATLIGLTIPHVLVDMSTISILLRAWLGKDRSLAEGEVYETGRSPLDVADEMKYEPGRLVGGQRPYMGCGKRWIMMKYMWDITSRGTKEEGRVFYLPAETVRKLRMEADEELDEAKGEWVSEHDLVVAWMLKMLHPDLHSAFSISQPVSARKWVPDLFSSKTFLGNAVAFVRISFPPASLATFSISRLALIFRAGLLTMTPDMILRSINMQRTFRGQAAFPNPPPTLYFTSWVAADLGNVAEGVKWGGACLKYEKEPAAKRYWGAVMAKDKEGGYWLTATRTPGEWRRIEEELQKGVLSATRATIVPEVITALGGRRAVYSLVLSTVIGTTVFHSFIGGPIQYKTLPRANFGNLQSKIFPTYFAIQGAGAAVCLGMWHYGHRAVRFDRNAFRFNAYLLGGMVVGAVANLAAVGPWTTGIMMQRHRLEKAEGKKYTDADVSVEMKELSSKFAVAHSVSALLNLGVLFAAIVHSAWIAEYASAL